MSRRVDFTLTDEQLEEVEEAINSSPHPEVRQRAIAIRLLHKGYKPEQVADLVAITANTIWMWHRHWREGGLSGLQDQPRSGRPRKATSEYCQVLEATLNSEPAEQGYSFTVWTMDRLRDHLEKQTGIRLSRTRFAMVMEREGYVYRRPKRDLASKQDKTAKQQAAELIEELKKGRNVVISSFSLWTKQPSA
ncbi:MAG: IS630 family transposase [Anaerolineae bacterium]|nr:IS630 family transposase [Anaerolineae bacterium]